MDEKITFQTVLEKNTGNEATLIHFPFDIEKTFGAKRVPVKVWINEAAYISTIVKMRGEYCMVVTKRVRDAAKVKGGEMIAVTIQRDTEKRSVDVPADFAEALQKANLIQKFEKLSYTHQKEFVTSISEAKKEETRIRRIEKAIEILNKK